MRRVNQNISEWKGKYVGWFLYNNKSMFLKRNDLINMIANHELNIVGILKYVTIEDCQYMDNLELVNYALAWNIINEEQFFVKKGEEWK